MSPMTPLRGALAAAALVLLAPLPAAQAGSFSATAFADVELLSAPVTGVSVSYFNDVFVNDGFASNPPMSYFDNDALIDAADPFLSTTLVSIGDALAPRGQTAFVNALLMSDGLIEIENTSGADVDLEFGYLFGLFADVMAQAYGLSTASAFARVELFWDLETLVGDFVDEIVSAALGAVETDSLDGSGTFTVRVPNNAVGSIYLIADAGGDAQHVPVPASLPLVAAGLALFGLVRRRRA